MWTTATSLIPSSPSSIPEVFWEIDENQTTRAYRLKMVRRLSGFTLQEVPQKLGISKHTFYAWESGRNPIRDKAIPKIIRAFRQVGIYCTEDWLMRGEGLSPRLNCEILDTFEGSQDKISETIEDFHANMAIFSEIRMFQKVNKNTDVKCLLDDAMLPFYERGDYVGGVRFFEEDIYEKALNRNCIIETKQGDSFIRRLSQGSFSGLYHLNALNLNSRTENCLITNVAILSAAPIVWHRKILN
ncbi:MAG: hypothetical protein B7Y25_02200 [Alphaproteobacteria bacterium 16-39-46]|nr:MAG: hypothetical protein B7Y25_02200 [Alphaproteobacteria bacterium 16-39-46]OZA43675.1 MAG: hypothetical protein B7X84_02550 [Alphaproteobacteria bacterium 17-39-52]HQS83727.1 hypothetical protein [Alphaproteobacteria bacterium]HQS93514.1 hypothetical protein [Alphaproteobacteria bacterium]